MDTKKAVLKGVLTMVVVALAGNRTGIGHVKPNGVFV